MDISSYNLEDFITDENFIHWVKAPSEESNSFWNSCFTKYPEKQKDMKEARAIILMLEFKEAKPAEGKFLAVWENISDAIADSTSIELIPTFTVRKDKSLYQRFKWMAAAILLLSTSCFYYLSTQLKTTIKTIYGESRTVFLPDSTKVTLNGNSKLTFSNADFTNNAREVWLSGEAFFSVVHKANNSNFLVHTGELEVEVLGTRFNVNSRRGMTKVILEEGKVKLNIHSSSEKSSVIMKPNEMATFSTTQKNVLKNKVHAEDYLSWKNNQLVFVGASLVEIAEQLEDSYGYEITFNDEEIAARKFTGTASPENIDEFFKKLQKLFDLEITSSGKKVKIQSLKKPEQFSRP